MRYLESYYTASIHKGGFDFLDHSPQLSMEELKELQKNGNYSIILNSNQPTTEEIEELCPINVAYFNLKSNPNRSVLISSRYIGRSNHTPDRYGNYFTHSIIIESNKISISLRNFFNTFPFKKNLSIKEDQNYQKNLGINSLDESFLVHQENEDFKYFCNFLNFNENRIKCFLVIINYIFNFKILDEKGQNISIVAEKDNLQDWVLAINFFLPKDLANKISFASYVKSPENYPFKITGLLPDSNFSSLDPKYFKVFDSTQESVKDVQNCEYAELIYEAFSKNNFELFQEVRTEIEHTPYSSVNQKLGKYIFLLNCHSENDISQYKKYYHSFTEDEITKYLTTLKEHNKISLIDKSLYYTFEQKINRLNWEQATDEFFDFHSKYIVPHSLSFSTTRQVLDVLVCSINSFDRINVYKKLLLELKFNIEDTELLNSYLTEIDNHYQDLESRLADDNDFIDSLISKYYSAFDKNQYQNIQKFMTYKELINLADNDISMKDISKYSGQIQELKPKNKIKIFLKLMNNHELLQIGKFESFLPLKTEIKKYLVENENLFWENFFMSNNEYDKNKNSKFHTLNYLKKKFVSELFQSEDINEELLSGLDFFDDYELTWIEEDIQNSNSTSETLNRFKDYVKNKKPRSSWGFFKR